MLASQSLSKELRQAGQVNLICIAALSGVSGIVKSIWTSTSRARVEETGGTLSSGLPIATPKNKTRTYAASLVLSSDVFCNHQGRDARAPVAVVMIAQSHRGQSLRFVSRARGVAMLVVSQWLRRAS